MIRMALENIRPGMILARDICSAEGKVLLAAGVKLEERYLARLKELGIPSVYIYDRLTEGIEIIDVVSAETRLQALATIKNLFQEAREARRLNIDGARKTVDNIISEILYNKNALINLAEVRAYDDYTFAHSVNVCVLSIVTAISLNFNQDQLCELGIGALLHDIGKTRIDRSLLNKIEPLSVGEFEVIKKHSTEGFEILRQYRELSLLAAHVAFQHHERFDGSGYPRGLQENQIHIYAAIAAVADVFDALTSDRVYCRGFLPHEALDLITTQAKVLFDPAVVAAFLENIAPYPVTTMVQLNTGEIGIVADVNRGRQHRPVVRILFDANLREIRDFHEIDLAKHENIFISRLLAPGGFPLPTGFYNEEATPSGK
ncbi:MAG: HD-GYP domain-containing protein [Bacillota bacterium]|nr:HD-GYP domain-containing protein [Bacillota bacterium]